MGADDGGAVYVQDGVVGKDRRRAAKQKKKVMGVDVQLSIS